MTSQLLLIVAESYRLTGLGVLAIGRPSEPVLQQFALHTKLEVRLHYPDGRQQVVVASVEKCRGQPTQLRPTRQQQRKRMQYCS
ncbi:hypothetical protein [Hymenobacter qilianensis]|uniref:Uncharacterized protein n=1 Tax=Hymenobacter qilianensis TaxID=1385715 RepID=A0A7H0GTT3_9BACT|nr:hypothetical protein [Hymenobacter qilianensis]QNP51699.1 hypothetical protein H9L05_17275 [Hymenobacter qilianensis]